ncbi:MAG: DUF87 domain-containing protein [Acidimicrobiia bacterium]
MVDFYLGGPVDAETGKHIPGKTTQYEASDLTTHGVIVGMTGSGKTGLGIIYLEEALRSGVPTLILDPKGDMTNLLLTFPNLAPSDFEPWIDPAAAQDSSVAEVAADTAQLWTNGLASWNLSGADIGALRNRAGFTIYTPGSTAGVPLNVIGSLVAPEGSFDERAEALRDEIQGFTVGLLGMVGIEADPISSRENVLIANLIEHAWRNGQSLGMETLLGWIQRPPIRRLGVFDIEAFFPADDRLALAMKLNGLLASPGFGTWMDGAALDIPSLLWDADDRPQAAVMYLAHLSDEERQFVVTLILSKLITWMRTQPGSGDLRVLAYMDEVFGFVPPTANPPAKRPILTLLKQARAFGVGLLLSTQNPVDLDYKAMSNAGTWCIGRLQTERDKARILEALTSVSGDIDVAQLDGQISGLAKRSFLLHNTRDREPQLFTTRWAMSYLRGPLTPTQITSLTPNRSTPAKAAAPSGAPEAIAASAGDDSKVAIMPPVSDGVAVFHLDPAAEWSEAVGASAVPTHYQAGAAVRIVARYDDTRAGVDHVVEWEAVVFPLTDGVGDPIEVDHEPRDFVEEGDASVLYELPEARIDTKTFWSSLSSSLKERMHREGKVSIFKNPTLKLYSRVGESREGFVARCDKAADDGADDATAKLRDKYEKQLRRIQLAIDKYGAQADAAAQDARSGDIDLVTGTVFDMLTGRSRSRSISSATKARRAAQRKVDAATGRVEAKVAEYEAIQEEFQNEVADLVAAWDEKATDVEELTIGLEKTDITVSDTVLVWIPRA